MKLKYALLKKSAVYDSAASYELPSLLELSKELESRRNLIEPELNALVQKAPSIGYFIPAPTKIAAAITPPNHLGFSSSPTHSSNLGCTLERGTLLGWFSTKRRIVFQVLVPEADIRSLGIGMPAICLLDSEPSRSIHSTIKKISPEPVQEIPTELFGEPMVGAVRNQNGVFQPETPHYLVTLETQGQVASDVKGAIGSVHFQLKPKTFAKRVGDYLRLTFRQK